MTNRLYRYDFPTDLTPKLLSDSKMWLGAESNRRHEDFQSSALPTELPSLLPMKFPRDSLMLGTFIDGMLTL